MNSAENMAGQGAMAANPELAAIPVITSIIQTFGGFTIMLPIYGLSILFILIGIILLSVDKNKIPGVMVFFLGVALGAGGFYFSRTFIKSHTAIELANAKKDK